MRTAAALEVRFLRGATNNRNVLRVLQRQQAIVLEQYHALGSNFMGQGVMSGSVKIPTFGRLRGQTNNPHDTSNGFVQHRLIEYPIAYRFDDGIHARPLRAGHLQVQSCLQRCHPVMNRTPIRNNKPFKPPFVFEDVGEQAVMFGGVGSVDFVVGAHDSPGFGFGNGRFKRRQINLTQSPFVNFCTNRKTLEFLVVGGKMFQRRAHTFALNAIDQARGQLPGQIRVFRKIFKVTAA